MNDGSVRQRPIGTGAPMLHGVVDLTGLEWALIRDQAGIVFELPDGTARTLFFGSYTTQQTGNTITSATVDLRLIQKLSADTLRAAKEEIRRPQGDL